MMWWIGIAAAAVIVIYAIYRISLKLRYRLAANKVVRLSLHRGDKKYADKHKCSFCKQKRPRLTFYANEEGKAVGVCDRCRPIAERRALPRL